jgi:hypothetical protein
MNGHDDKYSGSCAGYAINALDGKSLQEFEAHLREGCAACSSELSLMKEASALLPVILPQISPPPELKERIEFSVRLSQVVRSNLNATNVVPDQPIEEQLKPEPTKKPNHHAVIMGILIAMIVMLFSFSVYIYSLFHTLDEQKETSVIQQSLLAKSVEELEKNNTILEILKSRNLELIPLSGTEINPDGYGQIIWDCGAQTALMHAYNLPPLQANKEYKLWVSIKERRVIVPQCSLMTERGKEKYFKIKLMGNIRRDDVEEIFATQEPKGGNTFPSVERYLFYKKNKIPEMKRGD